MPESAVYNEKLIVEFIKMYDYHGWVSMICPRNW